MGKRHNIPLRKGIPYWVGIVITFIIMIPTMMLNGTYTGSSIDISGSLGVLTEDISMAFFATTAGMVAGYPLYSKVRAITTTKTIVLCNLCLQTLLAFVCARTSHIQLITVCGFMIGFLRGFIIIEIVKILKPLFSKHDRRSEFYSFFYPIVFVLNQMSMIVTAALAYHYQWQYMYYLIIGLLLLAIILVLICFRYGKRQIVIPFKEIDWVSVLIISALLLTIIYVVTYGKTKDWFDDSTILAGTISIPILGWIFFRRQRRIENPYLNLDVLSGHKPYVAYFFMALVSIFNSSGILISQFTTTILKLDSVHSNALTIWLFPGFILSAAFCYWHFNAQIWKFRVLIFWGMACFTGYFAVLYFGLTPNGTYEFFYLPMVLRGMGTMILFIAFGTYAAEDLLPQFTLFNAFFMITIRGVLSPAIGSSFFSNMLYRFQQNNQMILSQGVDMQNPLAASSYSQSLNSALAQGHPLAEAQQLATQTLYNTVQIQSTMVSIKQIVGYMLMASIVIMVIARFTPFHKTLKVAVPKTGEDMI